MVRILQELLVRRPYFNNGRFKLSVRVMSWRQVLLVDHVETCQDTIRDAQKYITHSIVTNQHLVSSS
jgi:hypothetical protein